jgi:hypothetical protein
LIDRIWSTRDGVQEFLGRVNADEELAARNAIRKVIKLGLLECAVSGSSKTWMWRDDKGKTQRIFTVPPSIANATEALYTYYKGSHDFQEDVKAVLLSKKIPAKEKVTD